MRIFSSPLVFISFVLLCVSLLIFFITDIKKNESLVVSEWARLNYLVYLIENKAYPITKTYLSPEDLKTMLQKKGFGPEVVKETDFGGIELRFDTSWEKFGELLSFLASKNLTISSLSAEASMDGKNFKIRMVIK